MPKGKANELVALPKRAPKDPSKVSFETVVAWVFRSGTKVYVDEQGKLHIECGPLSPPWLWETLYTHRDKLMTRARCQALDAYISERKYRLQIGASADLIAKGVPWLLAKCDELEVISGVVGGYDDPGNVFAWECVEGYRETLKSLLAG